MEFVKDLGIKQKEKLIVNNEESSVKSILNSCMWVQNQGTDLKTIREYCISNIGQLLMLNPVFANQEIQEKIEAIKTKDDGIMQKRHNRRKCVAKIDKNSRRELLYLLFFYIGKIKSVINV